MSSSIDLNLDAGESREALADGREEHLFELVTSVNIACGGHAGDEETMRAAVALALKHELAIGAHPSYPDQENFGREVLDIDSAQLTSELTEQIRALQEICGELGAELAHVKPHGALYHEVSRDRKTASAFFEALDRVGGRLKIVGFAGSEFLHWAKARGFATLSEGFVDRRYEDDGTLRPRSQPGSLIEDGREAGEQALSLIGKVDTLCIHGDAPGALRIARAVCATLTKAGVRIDRPAP